MKFVPKEITEEVNVTPIHPLVNLAHLLGTVTLAGVVIYVVLGLIAGQLVKRIGPETEEKIGASLVSSLPDRIAAGDSRLEYLHDLTSSLQNNLSQTGIAAVDYPPVKISILDTPEENAMVTAGSYLIVTEGLLAEVESENELAFVLAHELGHLHNRDPLNALGRSLVLLTVSGLLGLGQGPTSVLVPNVLNLTEQGHSRTQETTADEYAIALMMARYDHGGHSLDFFKRLQSEEFDLGIFSPVAEWQHTHPLTKNRIQNLESIAEANDWPLTGSPISLPEGIECPNFNTPC
ncbi:peptidase, M48 family [Synechococcus sp. PCC 7335]|uniref:M48 family metallopeptidase n=1 Tax=Synechococcus sp. (strain ATCC 29403 / PCC 7335) TaxID=91464 RepID=UPI00017EE014|nr:M48 family metallopeptidase [Synechococcus sp. PCC 7335]EDX87266.1 peptidase, M48 family [Synechococcus sp. PCC 7335]